MVIRKHCIEIDDANKFNAKFQCTTQSYGCFINNVNFKGSVSPSKEFP